MRRSNKRQKNRETVGIFLENGFYISKLQQEEFIMKKGALTHERAKSARTLPSKRDLE
jgi:hypothetical protein